MPKRWIMAAWMLWLALPAFGGTQGKAAGQGLPAEDAAAWVKQLRSPDPQARAQAHERLTAIGEPAEGTLREAIKEPALTAEARERIAAILEFVHAPNAGVAWVGGKNTPTPEGMQFDDVVTAVNGERITSWVHFQGMRGRGLTHVTFTVYRPGKGTFEIHKAPLDRCGAGFTDFPSPAEQFRRYGQKGAWDSAAVAALNAIVMHKDPLPDMEAAWKAGCRDAMVAYQYLRALTRARRWEEARGIAGMRPQELQGRYPGGEVRWGRFPKEVARFHCLSGDAARGDAMLAEAVLAAAKNGAWGAPAILRREQARQLLAGPAEKALAFWNEHKELLRGDWDYHILVEGFAGHLAAAGDPGAAARFLQGEPDIDVVRTLRRHYAAQAKAKEAFDRARVPPHKVLVRFMPACGPYGASGTQFYGSRTIYLPSLPLPGQVECEMRMVEKDDAVETDEGQARVYLSLCAGKMAYGRHGDLISLLSSTKDGIQVEHRGATDNDLFETLALRPLYGWNRVCLAMTGPRTQVTVNDVPAWTRYHEWEVPRAALVSSDVHNGSAQLRNVRYFAFCDVPADNAAIEGAYVALDKAVRAADGPAARAAADTLQKLLGPVPQAAPVLEELARDMKRFAAILSKDGLPLCTREVLGSLEPDTGTYGRIGLEGGWLTFQQEYESFRNVKLDVPLLLPDNLEIRGILDMSTLTDKKDTVSLNWLTTGCYPHSLVFIDPEYRSVRLGHPGSGEEAEGQDMKTPLPFCLRTRGGKVVLFLRYGSKPDLELEGVPRTGSFFRIRGTIGPRGRLRVGQLTVRHLADNVPLDAPVRLPAGPGATTAPTGKTRDW